MHRNDDLSKRLRERFASYEPEPETPWQELEARLADSAKPVYRKKRRVIAILLLVLMIGGIGFWISRQSHLWKARPASIAKGTFSGPHSASTGKSPREVKEHLQTGNRSLSAETQVSTNSIETKSTLNLADHKEKNPTSSSRHPENPENHESLLLEASSWSGHEIVENKIAAMHMLEPCQIADLVVGLSAPHLPAQPYNKEPGAVKPVQPKTAWVIKAGPLLGYNGMSSVAWENNSALHLENLRTSLPQRLGWHLYVGRQRPLSHGRLLEIGAVLRQFHQSIRYQVPTGAYSVDVQPDNSATVTQLRDTLSDQSVIRQAGLRLGFNAPVLPAAGLYGGVGGEAVYQFNVRDVVVNAEVVIGKKLTTPRSRAIMVELFANSAIRPAYDSHRWVRVLPYHVGLRIGVPLGVGR